MLIFRDTSASKGHQSIYTRQRLLPAIKLPYTYMYTTNDQACTCHNHLYGFTKVTALVGLERYDCKVDMLMPSHKRHPNACIHYSLNTTSHSSQPTVRSHELQILTLDLHKTTDTSNKNSGTCQQVQPTAHVLLSRQYGRGLAILHRLRRSHRHI